MFDLTFMESDRPVWIIFPDRCTDEETARQIGGLFDTMAASLSVGDHCSAQFSPENKDCPPEAGEKKCEKCQKNY